MPQYQPGMTYYTNNDTSGTPVPVVSQQDLDNLTNAGMTINTPSTTPAPASTLASAQQQAGDMLSGMTSPMTLDQIRAREQADKDARRNTADALFDPQISRARVTGAKQVSSAEGVTGQNMGFNISTAEVQFINSVQGQVDDKINEIVKSKADFIATGDFEAAKRADDAIAKLSEYNNNLIMKKAELALSLRSDQRSQDTLNLQTLETLNKLPAGKSVTVNGQTYTGLAEPEPFFKSADIVSLMKELTVGKTQTLTDPSTGQTYTITGMASSDPSVKTIQSYDNSGRLTITSYKIDPTTGQVSVLNQVSGGNVGKAKTGGGATAALSRTVLNKLNAKGLSDDMAKTVQSVMSQYDKATAREIIAQSLAQQAGSQNGGGISLVPELAIQQYGSQADEMINTYNDTINSSSDFDLDSIIAGSFANGFNSGLDSEE